jgi:NAD(P)-dependent dehydrogenase (short-subunit alcohol dehydrogenase family)
MPNARQLEAIAHVAPVLRGLLAESTGDADHPHRPVVLHSLVDKEALSYAATGKHPPDSVKDVRGAPLLLDPLKTGENDENLRTRLAASLQRYRSEHRARPEIICVPGVAVFRDVKHKTARNHDPRLRGRTAVVTGAAGAIGYGICQALLDHGCHVAITDLPGGKLDGFVAEFQKRDATRVIGVPMDVTDPSSVARGFAEVTANWGGVDIVVINAGIAATGPLTGLDLETFRRLERVNVEGTLLALAEAGRHFARQNTGGDIILISTKNVFSPGAGFGAYSATKAAAHQLARIASLEFAPLGVRVNMVAPDAVFSGGSHKSGLWAEVGPGRMRARGLDEKGLEEFYQNRNLLKARITAGHVANAVLFFALRQTPTTGACIPVDGGLPEATPR